MVIVMKRIYSAILAVLMLLSVCSVFSVHAAERIDLNDQNPYIAVDAGTEIVLTEYSVGGSPATVWKDGDGNPVERFTPAEKGVFPLTAEVNGESKNIYVIAKEKSETEFVLFEKDFSQYTAIEELEADGFTLLNSRSSYLFADGALVLGSDSDGYCRLILPAWLGDFGNYSVTAEAKMLTTTDNSRWFGLVYRIQNQNNAYYPYYHMCVRENTTSSSGIEFAERTAANGWNVAQAGSGEISSAKNAYHTYNVKAFQKSVQYNIDGDEVLYVDDSVIGGKAPFYGKGMIGLTMNYGTLSVKSIKVTVQRETPVRPEKKLELINNAHSELHLLNPIANVQYVSDPALLDSDEFGSALFRVSELTDLSAVLKKCLEKQILPTFSVASAEESELLIRAIQENGCTDVNVISENAEALAKMRAEQPKARTGLIVDPDSGVLDSKQAHAIRASVRSTPASFCVLKSEDATKQAVAELQELSVAVWVEVEADPASPAFVSEALKAVTSGANGIITKSASKLTETINTYLEEDAMTRTPVMIGHRGNPTQAPENTLSSFIKAYRNGADVFEIDVEITRDNEIIIMHDNTLNRTTNYTGSKTINQMTLAEVKEYFILAKDGSVSDEKVPTLREVLEEFKDKDCRIFVEFKGGNAANVPATAKLIKEYDMEDRVDVISFNSNFLLTTQAEMNGMSTGYLLAPSGSGATPEEALAALYPSLVQAQFYNSSINPSSGVVTPCYTQAVTDRGMTVWPWTYGMSSNNIGFLSGCNGVTTDDVQWASNLFKYLETSVTEATITGNATAELTVSAVTYSGNARTVPANRLIVKILEGEDCVVWEDNTLKGVKDGTAQVLFGFKTRTSNGSGYVLYAQPVTVTVTDTASVSEPADTNGLDTKLLLAVVAGIVLVIAIGATVIVVAKKKKK